MFITVTVMTKGLRSSFQPKTKNFPNFSMVSVPELDRILDHGVVVYNGVVNDSVVLPTGESDRETPASFWGGMVIGHCGM